MNTFGHNLLRSHALLRPCPTQSSLVPASSGVQGAVACGAVLLQMLSRLAGFVHASAQSERAIVLTGGGTPLLQAAASPCEPRLPRVSPAELQAKAMRLPSSTVPQSWIP